MFVTNLLDKTVRLKNGGVGTISAAWISGGTVLMVAVVMEDGNVFTVSVTDIEIPAEMRLYSVWLYRTDAQKIKAIKVVRSITGMGLKEAKDHVEKYDSNKVLVKERLTLAEADQIKHQIMAEDSMEVEIRKYPG